MQYTSKVALLAIALFGTSALAAPFEAENDVEAREVENDLVVREFDEMYVEARDDASLDARDSESMDLEAREYLEYLEERAAATAATPPQTPISHDHVFLTKHQQTVQRKKKIAEKEFQNHKVYYKALLNKPDKFHNYAVLKYLSKPKNLKKALADSHSLYHKAAKRVYHRLEAKAYLSHKKNYKKALKHRRNKYHKDAVKVYLSQGKHFKHALFSNRAKFHKEAVYEYLLDAKTRHGAISDEHHRFHKAAKRLQKKLDNLRKKSPSGTHSSTSTSATPSTNKA